MKRVTLALKDSWLQQGLFAKACKTMQNWWLQMHSSFETLLKRKTPVFHAAIYVGLAIRQSGYFLCELGTDHHTLPSDQVYPFAATYHQWSMYGDLLTSLAAECMILIYIYTLNHQLPLFKYWSLGNMCWTCRGAMSPGFRGAWMRWRNQMKR